jgi:hypothetical protein
LKYKIKKTLSNLIILIGQSHRKTKNSRRRLKAFLPRSAGQNLYILKTKKDGRILCLKI